MPAGPGVVTSSSLPRKWVQTEARWPGATWMFLHPLTPRRCPACPRLTLSSRQALPTHQRGKTSSTSEELVSNWGEYFTYSILYTYPPAEIWIVLEIGNHCENHVHLFLCFLQKADNVTNLRFQVSFKTIDLFTATLYLNLFLKTRFLPGRKNI